MRWSFDGDGNARGQVNWPAVPAGAWVALLYAGVVTSGMAHPGIAYAVGRCAAVVPSIYSCLQVPPRGLLAVYRARQ